MIPLRLLVPGSVWRATIEVLRPYAARRVESGCYWYGVRSDDVAVATMVGIPDQINRPTNFEVLADALAELVESLPVSGLVAVAQVHTHPGADTQHSPWDDAQAISRKVYSLVLPWYGSGEPSLDSVGVHCFVSGRWVSLAPDDVVERIVMLPSLMDTRPR